jgi:hypothetical protein
MSKLGYTWYPKDWGNSDSVFELSLSERGLYREFIDLAMLNNNTTEIKKEVWIRKFCVSENELNTIVKKLINLKLIEIKGNILFVPSCENRLKLVRAGSDGGKKSKPIVKPLGKPTPKPLVKPLGKPTPKPLVKPYSKPLVKQREKEIEKKVNSKEFTIKKDHPLFSYPDGDETRMRYISDPEYRKRFDHDLLYPL